METITFGLDEDGKPIEWIVLEKDNKKALLFKKYMEGFKSYHHESVSWENSLIRNYLNSEWMKETFNKK